MALAIALTGALPFSGYYWGYRANQDAALWFSIFWLKILVLSGIVGRWVDDPKSFR
jgi:hypothetical protein